MRRFNVRLVVANVFLRYPPIILALISLPAVLLHQVALWAMLAGGAVLCAVAVWSLAVLFEPAVLAWVEAGEEGPALDGTSRGAALSTGSERS
jgi:hypothetical protein